MTLEHKIDIDCYIWFEEKQQVDQKTVNIGVGWAENVRAISQRFLSQRASELFPIFYTNKPSQTQLNLARSHH